jgi:hypothetical protein
MPLPGYLLRMLLLFAVLCGSLDVLPLGLLLVLLLLLLLNRLCLLLLSLFGLFLLLSVLLFVLALDLLFLLLRFVLRLLSMLLWLCLRMLLQCRLSMLLIRLVLPLLLRMLLWLRWRMLLLRRLGMLLLLFLLWLAFLLCEGRNNSSERKKEYCRSKTGKCFHRCCLYFRVGIWAMILWFLLIIGAGMVGSLGVARPELESRSLSQVAPMLKVPTRWVGQQSALGEVIFVSSSTRSTPRERHLLRMWLRWFPSGASVGASRCHQRALPQHRRFA